MKYALMLVLSIFISGCVTKDVPLDYSKKDSPECINHQVVNHHYGTQQGPATTNISMECDNKEIVVAYKCTFGWGILSDTTCHKNN